MKFATGMAYRVDLTQRAARDLRRIHQTINAEGAGQSRSWFKALTEAIASLEEHPSRGAITLEDDGLRQLIHGRRRHRYRIIYKVDEPNSAVIVLHIRHGARDAFDLTNDN